MNRKSGLKKPNGHLLTIIFLGTALLNACASPPLEEPPKTVVTKVVIGATEIRPSSTITSSTDLEYLQSLIGLQFPPYPAGIHIDPFYLITPQINGTWGIAYEKYNGNHYIWLSFLVSRGENKTWEASDVIKIPNPSEEQFLIPGGCKMFGEFDSEIQAIVTINERDQSRRYVNSKAVNYAWRADRVTGLFSQLDTNYIECHTDDATYFPND